MRSKNLEGRRKKRVSIRSNRGLARGGRPGDKMANDNEDLKFEDALRRQLRPVGNPSEGHGTSAPKPGEPDCPDAEILAAFHEATLLSEEMDFVNAHLAICERCGQVFAQLKATDAVPFDTQDVGVPAPVTIFQKPAEISSFKRKPRWQWFVPAGAVAAALLLWMAGQPGKPPIAQVSPATQVAENRESESDQILKRDAHPARPPSSLQAELPQKAEPRRENSQPSPGISELRKEARTTENSVAVDDARDTNKRKKESGALKQHQGQISPQATATATSLGTPESTSAIRADAPAMSAAPAPAPLAKPAEAYSDELAAAKTAAGQESKEKEGAVSGAASNTINGAPDSAMGMAALRVSGTGVVSSPGGTGLWRAGARGLIEHSIDGGNSWSPQESGVTAELLTGSAPSDMVCWLAGRAATILLTLDGGKHWAKVLSPASGDILEIHAQDALHAKFLTEDTGFADSQNGIPANARQHKTPLRVSFVTRDGGATWMRDDSK